MRHPAASAYSLTQQRTTAPRQLEAGLLLAAAARLQQLRDLPTIRRSDLADAVSFNAKIWAIFQASALRQRRFAADALCDCIAELALAVFAASARLVARRAQATDPGHELGALIEINRIVAIGLRAP